jgi:hypothetical protein
VPFVKGTSASTASHRAFRDDREPPLSSGGMGRAYIADLPDGLSGMFFHRGLDTANQLEMVRKIRLCAQVPQFGK